MPITNITRDWSDVPSIVRIVTTDNFAAITAVNYLATQAAAIAAIQNSSVSHPFDWLPTDLALISYNGGIGFFTIDTSAAENTFIPAGSGIMKANLSLTAAQFKTIWTAGILMVPTAGPHTWILPQNLSVEYVFGTTQYTLGGAFGLTYSAAAPVHGAGTPASATEAAATIDAFAASNGFTLAGASTGTMASMVNMGIWVTSQTQDYATGDGIFNLSLTYRVVPTTT